MKSPELAPANLAAILQGRMGYPHDRALLSSASPGHAVGAILEGR